MNWSKNSDWITVKNAQAQVDFWEKDLQSAKDYLRLVKTFKSKKLPNYPNILKVAEKDVDLSKKNLEKARLKLKESIQRDGFD
jgi:hypothetical protein